MTILEEIAAERERQGRLAFDRQHDRANTESDWVACIAAYLGRAPCVVRRNTREGQGFRENMVKVGALAVAAIEAHDEGLGFATIKAHDTGRC